MASAPVRTLALKPPAASFTAFVHDAMATTFEILVAGHEADYARQAAETAFDELDRLENEMSRFIENSDVSRVAGLGAGESAIVGIATFECLRLANRLYAETRGAFDVTTARLLNCWVGRDGTPRTPSDDDLASARSKTGMQLLEIDEHELSVGLKTAGVQIDLGGIGKGYALDQMAALLRDWEIGTALLHAAESTVLALGAPPGERGWSLSLRDPANHEKTIGEVCLRDCALSGSGRFLHGRHIIDPRSGLAVEDKLATWAAAPNAALSDALSTAFMVMPAAEIETFCRQREGECEWADVSGVVAVEGSGALTLTRFGACDAWLTLT